MITRRRREQRALSLLLNLAIAIAVGHPIAASTRAHSPDPSLGRGTFPQDGTLEYDWRTGAVPPAPIRVAVNAAAADIEATRASRAALFAYDAGRDEPDRLRDRHLWRERAGVLHAGRPRRVHDVVPRARPGLRLGHAQVVPDVHERRRTAATTPRRSRSMSSVTSRDSATTSTSPMIATTPMPSCRRSRGRSHVRATTCTSWVSATSRRLQVRYDTEHASFPYSTCLDLPTKLSLSGNDTTLPYGGTETFTAFLEIVTDADYGRLSGNPVSRRTIKLQRRPPGGTPGPRSRRCRTPRRRAPTSRALRLYGSAEFRAVFSTPTDEGLRATSARPFR